MSNVLEVQVRATVAQAQAALSELAKAAIPLKENVEAAGKSADLASGKMGAFTGAMNYMKGAITGLIASGFGKFLFDAVKAQDAAMASINSLNLALANQGKLVPGVSERLQDYNAALQESTAFEADAITSAQAILASFGMNEEQIKATTKVALDFAAATGTDMRTAMELMGKASVGETAALGRYGIVVDDSIPKSQKFAAVVEQLGQRFGGAAAAQAQTFTGGLAQAKNAMGDAQEALGKLLGEMLGSDRPFGVVIESAKGLTNFLGHDAVIAFSEFRAQYMEFLASLAEGSSKLAGLFKPLLGLAEMTDVTGMFKPLTGAMRDIMESGPAGAEALRKEAAGIREAGDAAAAAAGKTLTFANSTRKAADERRGLSEAEKKAAAEVQKLIDLYSGMAADANMDSLVEAFQAMGGWAGIAKEQTVEFQKAIDAAVAAGAKLPEIFTPDTLKVGEAGKKIGSTLVNFAGNQIRHDMSIEANTMWVMAEAAAAKSGLTAGQEFSKMVGTSFVNLGQQIGSTFHSTFGQILGEGVSLFGKLAELGKLKLGEAAKNIAGALSAALGAFMAGFGAGKSKGAVAGAGIGALGGAATGAAAGSVIPGIGTVLGAVGGGIIGAIGGLFGGKAHDKQVAADLADLRKQLLATYGDMEHLRKVASLLGIDMSKAFTTKNPAELKKMMEQLSEAVEAQKKRLEGLSTAAGGFNGMAEAWGKALAAGGATDAAQAGFNRLGTYASAIFAGIVRETGDVIGALRQIGPGLDQMIQGQQQFGLVASATTANILGLYGVVQANEGAANSLTYLNQLMSGLNEAGMHSQSLFTAFGQDASQVFADLTAGGATGEQALALMQPTLQQLWEMQRDYGYEVDATTQALLDQAEQQGLVGDNMRSVNEKILEVLLGIAEVFKADIPEGLRRTNSAWGDLNHTASQTPWPNANAGEGGVPHGSAGGNGGGEHYAVGGTVPYTPGGRHVTVSEMETEHIMTSRQLDAIVSRAIGSAMRSGGGRMPPIHVESIVKIDNATLGKAMVRNSRAGNWRIHKSAVGNWR